MAIAMSDAYLMALSDMGEKSVGAMISFIVSFFKLIQLFSYKL
jgi:hypothetical protein